MYYDQVVAINIFFQIPSVKVKIITIVAIAISKVKWQLQIGTHIF